MKINENTTPIDLTALESETTTDTISPPLVDESEARDNEDEEYQNYVTEQLLIIEREAASPNVDVPFHKAGRDFCLPQFETALLSVCFNKPSIFPKIANDLDLGDLYLDDHREIYTAMLHVHNAGKMVTYKDVLRHLLTVDQEKKADWIKQMEALIASSGIFKQYKSYISQLKYAARMRGGESYCPYAYSEDFSANLLRARLPSIRCVGKIWHQYESGVWMEVQSQIFRPQAMAVIHPSHRQSRRGGDVLTHVESLAQYHKQMYGAYRFGDDGAVLVNAHNCVIMVSAQGEVAQCDHSPDYDFTRKLATPYDPSARCDLFIEKLEEILPDPQDREVFQLFCGYILYPSCKYETALVAFGPGGTGKSTMANVVADVLGSDLVGSSGLEELCKTGSYTLPSLKLKMLNLGSELAGKETVESANFKKLVSGEAMDVRKIYGEPEVMKATCKYMFLTNNQPRFHGGTNAEARRLRILLCDRKPQAVDMDLKDKLTREIHGVLNWMVAGLVKLLKTGVIPEGGDASKTALVSFSKGNDPIGSFVDECCILAPGEKVVKSDLFAEFEDWCSDNGFPADKWENFFWKNLLQRHGGLTSRRETINGTRTYCLIGIGLKNPREKSPGPSVAPTSTTIPRKDRPGLSPSIMAKLKNLPASPANAVSSSSAETAHSSLAGVSDLSGVSQRALNSVTDTLVS